MRRHVASAVIAALLMGVLALPSVPFFPPFWHWPSLLQWPVALVSFSGWPAVMILALLGVRGGPDGMPGGWLVPFAYFLQWWIILDLGLWARDALRQDATAVKKGAQTPSS